MDDLESLKAQCRELQRRIQLIETGAIKNDFAKIDVIHTGGVQRGKWAVSYKYFYIVRRGRFGENEEWEKWVPLFCAPTGSREEVVNEIPKIIANLQDLYDKAVKAYDTDP